jgi:anti-anti-sigma factor
MNTDFNIISEIYNDALVLRTDGYINNIAGEKILDEFSKNFNSGMNRVVMDLGKSKVVNSIGISYLIDIIEKLNEHNSKLIFTNLDPTIEKTFNIMGLFQFAQKADSVETALK